MGRDCSNVAKRKSLTAEGGIRLFIGIYKIDEL
jgi:hypothetical protein